MFISLLNDNYHIVICDISLKKNKEEKLNKLKKKRRKKLIQHH